MNPTIKAHTETCPKRNRKSYCWRWVLLVLTSSFISSAVQGAAHLTTLHSFNDSNGIGPEAALMQGADGFLYGTTIVGGTNEASIGGGGTIFRISTDGELETLVHLAYATGSNPQSGLIQARDSNFYGVTDYGGARGAGVVYRLSPDGAYSVLTSFRGTNGVYPHGLTEGSEGCLYGTTYHGGLHPSKLGTVFKTTTNGVITTLASFDGSNGAHPQTPLMRDADGAFYGTTVAGGTNGGFGTIFRVTPGGVFTSLLSLNGTNGAAPLAPPIRAADGHLYGTTSSGGIGFNGEQYPGYGTIYRISSEGTFSTVIQFANSNGALPAFTGLLQGSDGHLYGTTERGGDHLRGTVFRLEANGLLRTLVSFDGTNGASPLAGLVEASDGHLYGVAMKGGEHDWGTIFRLELATPAEVVQRLMALVDESGLRHKRPLQASLEAALASIERGNHSSACGQLGAFQNKVGAQVAKKDAALAMELIAVAAQVIDELDDSPKVAGRIHSLKRHPNGKMHMKMSGTAGVAYIVEASTNLVDWEAIGTASIQADGTFELEDPDATKHQSRFYRLAVPE